MSDAFYKTAMGRTFFDHTMPTLVKELQKLNENLSKLIKKTDLKEVTHVDNRESGGGVGAGDGGR